MKVFNGVSRFSVAVAQTEVETFNRSWPCSTLPHVDIVFTFDKLNGDLVNIETLFTSQTVDGPESTALSETAQLYGEKMLGINTGHFPVPSREHGYTCRVCHSIECNRQHSALEYLTRT